MFQFLVKSLYLSLSLSSHPLPPASPSKAFFPCRQNVVSFTNFSSLSSSPWVWTPKLLTINTWPFHRTDRLGDENERNFSKMVIKKNHLLYHCCLWGHSVTEDIIPKSLAIDDFYHLSSTSILPNPVSERWNEAVFINVWEEATYIFIIFLSYSDAQFGRQWVILT